MYATTVSVSFLTSRDDEFFGDVCRDGFSLTAANI